MTHGSAARASILDHVRRRPGISVTALRRATSLGWGSLYHHLRRLLLADLVRVAAAGGARLVFPAEAVPDARGCALRRALACPATLAVLDAVAAGAGRDVEAVRAATGMKARVVHYHLKRLVQVGAVESASRTRYRQLRPTPAAVTLARVLRREATAQPQPSGGSASPGLVRLGPAASVPTAATARSCAPEAAQASWHTSTIAIQGRPSGAISTSM